MRLLEADAAAALSAPLAALTLAIEIALRDGARLDVTPHDRDLVVGDRRYRAVAGLKPSAIEFAGAGRTKVMDIELPAPGWRSPAAGFEIDRFLDAEVTVAILDWMRGMVVAPAFAEGFVRAISVSDGAWTLAVAPYRQRLQAHSAPRLSSMCRATFGDSRCTADTGARQALRVASVRGAGLTISRPAIPPPGEQPMRLRVLTGLRSGADVAVSLDAGELWLGDPLTGLAPGDAVELRADCDKTAASCRSVYRNFLNFRGEPLVPGDDLLTAGGGA